MKRRSFLSQSSKTAAILAAGTAPAYLRSYAQKPEGKVGVALVGLGGFSEASIAPEIAKSKHVWFAGAVTSDPGGKGKEWAKQYGFPEKNLYTYDEMDKLADNPDIDFVHIVTPNGLHAEHSIAAAKAGKHVMCEKPMAVTADECRAMIAAAKDNDVLLGTSYRLHWEPHHQKLMEFTGKKTYGNPKSITTEFSWNRRDNKPWLLDKALAGGGAFFDTGVYTIQAGCYATGEAPISAVAHPTTTRDVYPEGVEETMSAILQFPGGAVMTARASYAYGNHLFTVAADKGTYRIEADASGSGRGSVFGQSGRGNVNGKRLEILRGGKIETIKFPDVFQLANLHDAFAESILNKTPFKADGEMGLRDIIITEAIYESVAQGGKEVPIVYS
ncbi:MAG: Gfo/Idh/MocA family oxidoreductase [Verrucomicrobiota bacterium]